MTRRRFLAWLAATPLLAFLRPAAPVSPKFTGGFGPLNPPKPSERSFWEPQADTVGQDDLVEYIKFRSAYVDACKRSTDFAVYGPRGAAS